MPIITALYAGLLGLIAIGIIVPIGRARGASGVSIGDGGNEEVIVAMRRQANFVEFVPLVLILIGLLELNGVASGAIHGLGAVFVISRLCHAVGYGSDSLGALRGVGAMGSMLALAVSSIWAIIVFV